MRFSFLNTQVTACYNIIIRAVCTGIIGVTFTLYISHFSALPRYTYLRAEELSLEFAALKIRKRNKSNHEYETIWVNTLYAPIFTRTYAATALHAIVRTLPKLCCCRYSITNIVSALVADRLDRVIMLYVL